MHMVVSPLAYNFFIINTYTLQGENCEHDKQQIASVVKFVFPKPKTDGHS